MSAVKLNNDLSSQSVFNDSEIAFIIKMFSDAAGIELGTLKSTLIESRLRKRILDLDIDGVSYIQLLMQDQNEKQILIDLLTTHKTDWYREMVHYHFLSDWLTKEGHTILKKRELMFWSAASSTGEEVYSMALHLISQGIPISKLKLLGTDISSECVNKGVEGIFPFKILSEQVPLEQIKNNFTKFSDKHEEKLVQINPDIRNAVKFRVLNLCSSPNLPTNLQFDVVFLRNVLIYFSAEKANIIIQNVSRNIRVGGYLILGLSEALPGSEIGKQKSSNFESCGSSIFRKTRP